MEIVNKKLKELVSGKTVEFIYFRSDEMWFETEDGFKFPVPIFELDGAEVRRKEKASLLLRWISRYLKEIQDVNDESKPEKSFVTG